MALLSNTNPDPTPRSTLCCDSTAGSYKHSDPEKKGKKERRELKTKRRGRDFMYTFIIIHRYNRGNKSKQVSLTPAAQCRAGFEPCEERRLSEQKSPLSSSVYFSSSFYFVCQSQLAFSSYPSVCAHFVPTEISIVIIRVNCKTFFSFIKGKVHSRPLGVSNP